MTRMREINWPQPTWRFTHRGSPYGTKAVRDEKNQVTHIVLNRATRRRLERQNTTHLERLGAQEAKRDHVRYLTRKK